MARSRAKVRVFSDDGHCVHDARIMRRALEYVKPFGGVISQHAQDPRLAGREACCHEGEVSGRLGLPGWPGIAEESIVARDVMLARHTGSRVHVAHVSTAGHRRGHPLGQGAGHRRDGGGDAAPPGPDHRPAHRLRPRLQGQPAAAPHRGRRGAAGGSRRRHHRRRRHRPRAARPPRQGARLRRRRVRHARPRDGPVGRQRRHGAPRPARLGRRRARHVDRRPPGSAGSPTREGSSPSAAPPTSPSSTPTARSPSTPPRAAAARATTRGTDAPCAEPSRRRSTRGASPTTSATVRAPDEN